MLDDGAGKGVNDPEKDPCLLSTTGDGCAPVPGAKDWRLASGPSRHATDNVDDSSPGDVDATKLSLGSTELYSTENRVYIQDKIINR